MKLKAGPHEYTVEVVDSLYDAQAKPCLALCDYGKRKILLSSSLDRRQRRHELRHEYYHACAYAFPGLRDEEHQADFSASVSEALDEMIATHGGWGVLDLLFARHAFERGTVKPVETPPPLTPECFDFYPVRQREQCESIAPASGERSQCGHCGTVVGGGSIVSSGVRYDSYAGGKVVTRTFFCPHCEHLVSWDEGVSPQGAPNGMISKAHSPERRSEVVDAFLRKFPQAVGLIAGEG